MNVFSGCCKYFSVDLPRCDVNRQRVARGETLENPCVMSVFFTKKVLCTFFLNTQTGSYNMGTQTYFRVFVYVIFGSVLFMSTMD